MFNQLRRFARFWWSRVADVSLLQWLFPGLWKTAASIVIAASGLLLAALQGLPAYLDPAFEMRRINHSVAFSLDGACTNLAESYFSRLRRTEFGQHHHISGKYLFCYAAEMAWKEDNCRQTNGALYLTATGAALNHPVSRVWKGYWQRTVK